MVLEVSIDSLPFGVTGGWGFLLFSDVDREDFLTWTPLLLKTMQAKGADLATEQMSYLKRVWTKNDLYDLMCPGLLPQDDNGGHYNGNFVLLQIY